jgi:hypothetical protein
MKLSPEARGSTNSSTCHKTKATPLTSVFFFQIFYYHTTTGQVLLAGFHCNCCATVPANKNNNTTRVVLPKTTKSTSTGHGLKDTLAPAVPAAARRGPHPDCRRGAERLGPFEKRAVRVCSAVVSSILLKSKTCFELFAGDESRIQKAQRNDEHISAWSGYGHS